MGAKNVISDRELYHVVTLHLLSTLSVVSNREQKKAITAERLVCIESRINHLFVHGWSIQAS